MSAVLSLDHPFTAVIRPQPKDPNSIERKGFDGLAEPGAPEPICSGPGCHGRRHFEHKPTETTVWRPGRRKLVAAHDGNSYPRLQGKKMLEEPMPPEKRRAERNHMKDIAYLSGYDRPGYVEITDVQVCWCFYAAWKPVVLWRSLSRCGGCSLLSSTTRSR
jgi:hypothetical protein